MTDSAWIGSLALDTGWALFLGGSAATDLHAHHAIQIGLSVDDPIAWTLAGDRRLEGRGLAIGSDVPHAVARAAAPVAHLYVDPESASGRRLAWAVGEGTRATEGAAIERACGRLVAAARSPNWPKLCELRASLLAALGGAPAARPSDLDPRIARTLRRLRAPDAAPVSGGDLASAVGLSVGRLSHLFRRQTGVSIRTYRLWWKLRGAILALHDGSNLTEAALQGGFSDSAHLSRTFRRMFGATPSRAVGELRILLPPGRTSQPDRSSEDFRAG